MFNIFKNTPYSSVSWVDEEEQCTCIRHAKCMGCIYYDEIRLGNTCTRNIWLKPCRKIYQKI